MDTSKTTRPRKSPDQLRKGRLLVKLTKSEHDEVLAIADQPTIWARKVLLKAARRKARQA